MVLFNARSMIVNNSTRSANVKIIEVVLILRGSKNRHATHHFVDPFVVGVQGWDIYIYIHGH